MEFGTFMRDPRLAGKLFGPSWRTWTIVIKAAVAEPLDASEMEVYRRLTNRDTVPAHVSELWCAVGRRGGKTRAGAALCCFLAFIKAWPLAPGESGYIRAIFPDRRQGRIFMGYVQGMINAIPAFRAMVERETTDAIYLSNRIIIEIGTCSSRTTRGYSMVACLCDELAFWKSEDSTEPATEVLNAVRPALATFDRSLLIVLSTVYARRGEFFDSHEKNFGVEDDHILFVKGTTRDFNSTLPRRIVDQALARDRSVAEAEFLSIFRSDLETLLQREAVLACVESGVFQRPYRSEHKYIGVADPAGGGSSPNSDEFAISIGHVEDGILIQDALAAWKTPNPQVAVEESSKLFREYKVRAIAGDRYASGWVATEYARHGITYRFAEVSASQSYAELAPRIHAATIRLLDDEVQTRQLLDLERRTGPSGRDSISHPLGRHDDRSNACGLLAASQIGAPLSHAEILRRILAGENDFTNVF